jgi:hypothetical protein
VTHATDNIKANPPTTYERNTFIDRSRPQPYALIAARIKNILKIAKRHNTPPKTPTAPTSRVRVSKRAQTMGIFVIHSKRDVKLFCGIFLQQLKVIWQKE